MDTSKLIHTQSQLTPDAIDALVDGVRRAAQLAAGIEPDQAQPVRAHARLTLDEVDTIDRSLDWMKHLVGAARCADACDLDDAGAGVDRESLTEILGAIERHRQTIEDVVRAADDRRMQER